MTSTLRSDDDPPHYFVVDPGSFRMTPGLHRLGHDFGNGVADTLCFQRDRFAPQTLSEKERILSAYPERLSLLGDPRARALELTALGWMKERLQQEHGKSPALDNPALDNPSQSDTSSDFRPQFRKLTLEVQEDFALLQRTEEGDRLILLSVCFPSGWRPELLLGKDFLATHKPVPEFDELAERSQKLAAAITERGPYVRFAWSLTADDRLDHHPDHAPRDAWTESSIGYLRVERQVTIPFPQHQGCLFLIRTYLTPFAELSAEERTIIHRALQNMPDSVREYKGLFQSLPLVLQALERPSSPAR